MDITRGEVAESNIDAFIRQRDNQRRKTEGERPAEEMWRASARRYSERVQQQQMWWERLRYRERMIASHTATFQAIIAAHEEDLARCRHALGLEDEMKGDAA